MDRILILTLITTITAQTMDIQDLTNNNGYVPIKTGEFRPIEYYSKILHILNLTEYERTLDIITENINALRMTTFNNKPLLDTIDKNFELLQVKVDNLHPRLKSKRGLANIIGKGLKLIAGTMDSDDELEIEDKLKSLNDRQINLTGKLNTFTQVNNFLSLQIQNITNHINRQQYKIGKYLDDFKNILQNKIATLEDEFTYMTQIYQINNDILLFKDHIDDIGQIIFSSKLGIIPSNILTKTELDLITDFDSYKDIKVSVAFHNESLVIILQIPHLSENYFSRIQFEPIPNMLNKSIILDTNEVLVDLNNNIFENNVKNKLMKNMIKVNNECLKNILLFEEANCPMEFLKDTEIIEIIPGVLIFKNFLSNITHNCNKMKLKQTGNFIIKFENCQIDALNKTYMNVNIKIYDKIILPNILTKVKETEHFTLNNIKLESLFMEQIKYKNNLDQIIYHNNKFTIISNSIDVIIVICIITICVMLISKSKQKFVISSEPHTNGGGVTTSKIEII